MRNAKEYSEGELDLSSRHRTKSPGHCIDSSSLIFIFWHHTGPAATLAYPYPIASLDSTMGSEASIQALEKSAEFKFWPMMGSWAVTL